MSHKGKPRGKCKSCTSITVKMRYDSKKIDRDPNKNNVMPDAEWLHDNFKYCDSGRLIRKTSRGKHKAGSVVTGKLEAHGYVRVGINCSMFLMHRIIWKMHHGNEPKYLDHIDHNRSNNKIENLREISKLSNSRNQKVPANNTSGFIGVSKIKASGKWKAMIGFNYKDVVIGTYENIVDAVNAYNRKALELHGDECAYKVEQNKAELKRRGLA